jgi:hypothetical protein
MWVEYIGIICLSFCVLGSLVPLTIWDKKQRELELEPIRAFSLIARIVKDGQSKYEILHINSSCEESITLSELFEAYPEHSTSDVSVKSTFLSKDSVLVDGSLINIVSTK